tara:strand:+ start:62 stop:292 length:231 start_codon:yes stop_codon:yes gene_type:complete
MTEDKYKSKNLSQALAHVMEESGELQAAYGKSMRWGWHSYNPELGPESEINWDWVMRELNDLEDAIAAFRTFEPRE